MNYLKYLLVLSLLPVTSILHAQDPTKNGSNKFSLHTLSFVHHLSRSDDTVEGFSNQLSMLSMALSEERFFDDAIMGTLIHSGGKRCLVLGARKNWQHFSDRLSFTGTYAYVGEAPSDLFNDCGDNSVYEDIKDMTGVGFAPYIYHGFEYDLNQNISLHGGFTFINILSANLEYSW